MLEKNWVFTISLTTMEKIEIRAQIGRIEYKNEFEFVNPIWLKSLLVSYLERCESLWSQTEKSSKPWFFFLHNC